jgi:hypothetical protein
MLSSCTASTGGNGETTGALGEPLSPEGAVAELVALGAASSAGGAAITPAEAAGYIADIPSFGGDETTDALGVLASFQDSGTDAATMNNLTNELRAHVQGIRIAGMTVDGLSISYCSGSAAAATFDPKGANYAGVTIVYAADRGWAPAYSAQFTLGGDNLYHATLAGLDPQGTIVYAIEVEQPSGDTLWLNNPRENQPGAVFHWNYFQYLHLCEPVAVTSTPPFGRLIESFTLPESAGGATVVQEEFDWLVAQWTYEGVPPDDPDVLGPTVATLDAMYAAGDDIPSYGAIRSFLLHAEATMRVTTTSAVTVQRNETNQWVQITAPLGSQWMRIYYSTDGWDTPKVVECTPTGRLGYVSCGLGYMPIDTLLSFSAIVRNSSGGDDSVHAGDGGNVFGKVR